MDNKVDKWGNTINKTINITSQFSDGEGYRVIKAEQKGHNILILRKILTLNQYRSDSNNNKNYELEYRWLNPKTGNVLGSTYSYYRKSEFNLNDGLFNCFDLIN
jgi:hypothetical protein